MLMLKKPWEKVRSGGGRFLGGGAGFLLAPCFRCVAQASWLLSGEKFSTVARLAPRSDHRCAQI